MSERGNKRGKPPAERRVTEPAREPLSEKDQALFRRLLTNVKKALDARKPTNDTKVMGTRIREIVESVLNNVPLTGPRKELFRAHIAAEFGRRGGNVAAERFAASASGVVPLVGKALHEVEDAQLRKDLAAHARLYGLDEEEKNED